MQRRVLGVLVALAACSAPSSTASAPVAVPVLPDVPFALLDREQRARFMEERVVPAMAPLFRAYDAGRYGTFGCTTCHAAPDDLAMPNPRLPLSVDPAQHDARAVEWMTVTIQPAMARLLGDDALDCMRCHVRAVPRAR